MRSGNSSELGKKNKITSGKVSQRVDCFDTFIVCASGCGLHF